MKVFIAGPRSVSRLNQEVQMRLQNIINKGFTILVGDANGIDKQIQIYCHAAGYNQVSVFASNGKARNNVGNWAVNKVEVPSNVKGVEFYTAKDLKMIEETDYGFMIWNGKSKGTLNNIINLTKLNKKILVYFIPHKKFYSIKNKEELSYFLEIDNENRGTTNETNISIEQITLFDS